MRSIFYEDQGDKILVTITRGFGFKKKYILNRESPSLLRLGRVVANWVNNGMARPTINVIRRTLLIENVPYTLRGK